MNVYLMTDLEAVAGVIDSLTWCTPGGQYFDTAKELLTLEANAAIEGFLAAGAKRIVVCDGHGWGGIHPQLLHPDAELIAGSFSHTPCPYGLDTSFDAVAWVGQHAMAGTANSHLPHTGSFNALQMDLNGQPIGEMGQFAYCAAELGVRSIFFSGDQAGCDEAAALIPGIETVAVKVGMNPHRGLELIADQAERAYTSARHLSPKIARERIRKKAGQALRRAREDASMGRLILPPSPYTFTLRCRNDEKGKPGKVYVRSHPESLIGAMNAEYKPASVHD